MRCASNIYVTWILLWIYAINPRPTRQRLILAGRLSRHGIVRDYLRVRNAQHGDRLFAALRRGQLELQAFYTQPLTELASAEESIDSIKFAAQLGREQGFLVQCAMFNDIGGYMGRLPSILNGWGVQYLVAGVGSYQVHMPWCDLPYLFYLQDKAGGRILVWNLGIDRTKTPQTMAMLDAVYSMGGTYLISPWSQEISGIDKGNAEGNSPRSGSRFNGVAESYSYLTHRLQNEKYPYPQVMLQYGKDNGAPDPQLPELLKKLKHRNDIPHVELTTPIHFFNAIEQQHAGKIPVLSGVITDPRVLCVNPQPAPLAQHRAAQRRLIAAESRRDWWRDLPYDPSSLRCEGDEFVIDLVVRPNSFVVLGIGHKIVEEEFFDLSDFFESNMGFNDSKPDDETLDQIRKTIGDYRHKKE